jgi:hypothetical protein
MSRDKNAGKHRSTNIDNKSSKQFIIRINTTTNSFQEQTKGRFKSGNVCCHSVQNWVLMGIFWSKRGDVTGKWRKLHNEELNYLHTSPKLFERRNEEEWFGWVCRMFGRERVAYTVVVSKPEGNTTWKTRRRWDNDIKK